MKTDFKKVLSLLLCLVLIAASVFGMASCGSQAEEPKNTADENTSASVETSEKTEVETEAKTEAQTGETVSFTLEVVDAEGNKETTTVETTEKTVGAALLKEGIVEGEDGPYGLYIKKVNGIFADYETSGTYWAFYVNGEYATTGPDQTDIEANATYTFKVEK